MENVEFRCAGCGANVGKNERVIAKMNWGEQAEYPACVRHRKVIARFLESSELGSAFVPTPPKQERGWRVLAL